MRSLEARVASAVRHMEPLHNPNTTAPPTIPKMLNRSALYSDGALQLKTSPSTGDIDLGRTMVSFDIPPLLPHEIPTNDPQEIGRAILMAADLLGGFPPLKAHAHLTALHESRHGKADEKQGMRVEYRLGIRCDEQKAYLVPYTEAAGTISVLGYAAASDAPFDRTSGDSDIISGLGLEPTQIRSLVQEHNAHATRQDQIPVPPSPVQRELYRVLYQPLAETVLNDISSYLR